MLKGRVESVVQQLPVSPFFTMISIRPCIVLFAVLAAVLCETYHSSIIVSSGQSQSLSGDFRCSDDFQRNLPLFLVQKGGNLDLSNFSITNCPSKYNNLYFF